MCYNAAMSAIKKIFLPTLASYESCSGCTACKAICPRDAIAMRPDDEGFLRPQVDGAMCVGCHLCERVCPVLHPGAPDASPTCYAAYTKDEELRLKSSSGGIFTELARPIIESGGVVFGCIWERPQLVAIHAKAETRDQLAEMRGSKYVQSDVRDTFREAKAALLAGRQVLFSGTPCQIAGLNAFLGKPYVNLLTVEVVCHGTPSPAVFEAYKRLLRRDTQRITGVAFRRKNPWWRQGDFVAECGDAVILQEWYPKNAYVEAFLSDLCLRPSCARCGAKDGRSGADLTIADFWGIEQVCPELDDDRGTSLVIIHTDRGQEAWQQVDHGLNVREVPFEAALAGNPSYRSSVPLPKGRRYFMQRYQKTRNWVRLIQRAVRGPWMVWMGRRILGRIKRILKGAR